MDAGGQERASHGPSMGRWMAALPSLGSLGEILQGLLSLLALHVACGSEDRKPGVRKAWFLDPNYLALGPQSSHPLDSLCLSFFSCHDIRVIVMSIF